MPLTQPWYRGLVNARGNLLGVIDFGLFCGEGHHARAAGQQDRGAVRQVERACGIIATRVVGLRHAGDLSLPHGDAPAGRTRISPPNGTARASRTATAATWQVLDIRQLLDAPAFLQVGRVVA